VPHRIPPSKSQLRIKKRKTRRRRVEDRAGLIEIDDALPELDPERQESEPDVEERVQEIDFTEPMEATERPHVPDENESEGETITIDRRQLISSFGWDFRKPTLEQGAFQHAMGFMSEQFKDDARSPCLKRKGNLLRRNVNQNAGRIKFGA
jgi:hypothetical protein